MKSIALALALLALPAVAKCDFNQGPTASLIQARLKDPLGSGNLAFYTLGSGTGYQATCGFFPVTYPGLNKKLDAIDVGAVALLNLNTSAGNSGSIGVLVGTASGLFTVGFGIDALAQFKGQGQTGFLVGKVGSENKFWLATVNLFRVYQEITGAVVLP